MIASREKTSEMIFAENLRRLMERDGLKQRDLVEALNVVQGAVSGWVNGKTPDFPNQQKIAKYFQVTVADLFTDNAREAAPRKIGEAEKKKPETAEVMELRE